MKITVLTAILTLAASLATAAPPKPRHATPPAKSAPLQVDSWFSLHEDTSGSPAAAFRDLAEPAPQKGVEQITVLGYRRNRRDEAWRQELSARTPTYEAGASDAAQPLVPYAAWTSPDQQRMMSGVKQDLGLCHWPLTCPDP